MSPRWLTPPPIRDIRRGYSPEFGVGSLQVDLTPEQMQRFQTRLGAWNSDITADDALNPGVPVVTSFSVPTSNGGDTALDRITSSLQIGNTFSMVSDGAPITGAVAMIFISMPTNSDQSLYYPPTEMSGVVGTEYVDHTTQNRPWAVTQSEDWEEWATAELQDGAGNTWTIQLYIEPPLAGHGGLLTDWKPTSWTLYPTLYITT